MNHPPTHSRDAPGPIVLAIETSCDDTACAVLDGEGRVLASVVSSQLAAHRPFGGVVPEIASREHLLNWPAVCQETLRLADLELGQVDAVAATRGPGLMGSLLVGLSLGKALSYGLHKPFYGIHHLEGHLVSPFLPPPAQPAASAPQRVAPAPGSASTSAPDSASISAPDSSHVTAPSPAPTSLPPRFTGLVVSGGHTSLFDVDGDTITPIAETRDDAFGEVFDKVGKGLGLPYPQGPLVDALAEHGHEGAETLPIASTKASLDFSYSGLKTETLGRFERLRREGVRLVASAPTGAGEEPDPPAARPRIDGSTFPQPVLDVLTGFRYAAVEQILRRLRRYHRRAPIRLLAVSGGAAANRLLRRRLQRWAEPEGIDLRLVALPYSGDNAAMIGYAALLRHLRGEADDLFSAEAVSRLQLGISCPTESP